VNKVIDCSAKLFAPMSKRPAPVGSPYAFIIAYDARCPYCGFAMHESLDPSISIHGGLQLNPVNRCAHFVAAVIESENDAQGDPNLLKVMVSFNEQKIEEESNATRTSNTNDDYMRAGKLGCGCSYSKRHQ